MISPEELVHRARKRCKHHRQPRVGNSVDASVKGGKKLCKKSDWKNDEPLMKGRDRDCAVDKGGSGREDDRCVPVL